MGKASSIRRISIDHMDIACGWLNLPEEQVSEMCKPDSAQEETEVAGVAQESLFDEPETEIATNSGDEVDHRVETESSMEDNVEDELIDEGLPEIDDIDLNAEGLDNYSEDDILDDELGEYSEDEDFESEIEDGFGEQGEVPDLDEDPFADYYGEEDSDLESELDEQESLDEDVAVEDEAEEIDDVDNEESDGYYDNEEDSLEDEDTSVDGENEFSGYYSNNSEETESEAEEDEVDNGFDNEESLEDETEDDTESLLGGFVTEGEEDENTEDNEVNESNSSGRSWLDDENDTMHIVVPMETEEEPKQSAVNAPVYARENKSNEATALNREAELELETRRIALEQKERELALREKELELERRERELERRQLDVERGAVTKPVVAEDPAVVKNSSNQNKINKPVMETKKAHAKPDFDNMVDDELWRIMKAVMTKLNVAKAPIDASKMVKYFGGKNIERMRRKGYIISVGKGFTFGVNS